MKVHLFALLFPQVNFLTCLVLVHFSTLKFSSTTNRAHLTPICAHLESLSRNFFRSRHYFIFQEMPSPTDTQWQNLFYTYAACTLIIAVKYQVSQWVGVNPDNHPAEDEKMMENVPKPASDDIAKRRFRQAANDVENIPWNMVVFWAAFSVQNMLNFSVQKNEGQTGTQALMGLIIIYTVSRCLFTVCYIGAIQPFRSIFFFFGALSTLAAAAVLMYTVTKIDVSNWK